MYNETVREPQLVITTPDPCDHYEATVTPMCGSITGAQTSPVKLGGDYIPLYIVVYGFKSTCSILQLGEIKLSVIL